jgi:hypothetical protein
MLFAVITEFWMGSEVTAGVITEFWMGSEVTVGVITEFEWVHDCSERRTKVRPGECSAH